MPFFPFVPFYEFDKYACENDVKTRKKKRTRGLKGLSNNNGAVRGFKTDFVLGAVKIVVSIN